MTGNLVHDVAPNIPKSLSVLRLSDNRIEHVVALKTLAAFGQSLTCLDVRDNYLEVVCFDAKALYGPLLLWLLPRLDMLNEREVTPVMAQRARDAFHTDDGGVVSAM